MNTQNNSRKSFGRQFAESDDDSYEYDPYESKNSKSRQFQDHRSSISKQSNVFGPVVAQSKQSSFKSHLSSSLRQNPINNRGRSGPQVPNLDLGRIAQSIHGRQSLP